MQKHLNSVNQHVILDELLYTKKITQEEYDAGITFVKLYIKIMRSQGINNRIKTYSQNWEKLQGKHNDVYCSYKAESLWRKILHLLNPLYHRNKPIKQFLLCIAEESKQAFEYPNQLMKYALNFLVTIWEVIQSKNH